MPISYAPCIDASKAKGLLAATRHKSSMLMDYLGLGGHIVRSSD
jgi:hypothetical protein